MSFSCKMKTIYQKYTRMADNWEYVNVWILKVTLLTAKFFKRTHNLAQVSTDRIYSTACTQCTYSLSSIMSKVININGYTNNLNEKSKMKHAFDSNKNIFFEMFKFKVQMPNADKSVHLKYCLYVTITW